MWLDWTTRRIPNWLTLPFASLGIIASFATLGIRGGLLSMAAAVSGVAVGFVLYAFGVSGGGDGKLIGAVGSIGGLAFLGQTLLWTAIVGLFVSAALLAWKRALIPLLRRLARAGWDLLVWNLPPSEPVVSGDGHRMPFGIVIAAGALAAWIARASGFEVLP